MKNKNQIICFCIGLILVCQSCAMGMGVDVDPPDTPEFVTPTQTLYGHSILIEWTSESSTNNYHVYVDSDLNLTTSSSITEHLYWFGMDGTYELQVSASNSNGDSGLSDPISITISSEDPEVPEIITEDLETDIQVVQIEWEPSSYTYSYNVYVDNELYENVEATSTYVNFPTTGVHTVEICAVNGNSISENSTEIIVTITNALSWEVNQIHIDNLGIAGNGTWADMESEVWLSGSGTALDPYLISEVLISNPIGEFGILVENSHGIVFQIKECLIMNTPYLSNYKGIYLKNVTDGKVISNDIIDTVYGIYVDNCTANSIVGNSITNQTHYGNYMGYNTGGEVGIYFADSYYTLIENNGINFNFVAIYLDYNNDNTTISKNYLDSNIYGIVSTVSDSCVHDMNKITNVRDVGVVIQGSLYNNITTNEIIGENTGIFATDSNSAYFYNNTIHTTELGMNITDSSVSVIRNTITSIDGFSWDNTQILDCIGNIFNYNDDNVDFESGWNVINGYMNDTLRISVDDPDETFLRIQDAVAKLAWINGKGTESNPYTIKDIKINIAEEIYGFAIADEPGNYLIENCTFDATEDMGYIRNAAFAVFGVDMNVSIINNQFTGEYVYALELGDCDQVLVANNTFSSNYLRGGIKLAGATNTEIMGNYIADIEHGILLSDEAYENVIHDNILENLSGFGIAINTKWEDGSGYVNDNEDECYSNIIYKNSFIQNNLHAISYGDSNDWSYEGIGNYWDNYTGTDADFDGIGDTAYASIEGTSGDEDQYPIWDDHAPNITILNPQVNSYFASMAPPFSVEIVDPNLSEMWYTIDSEVTNHTFTENSSIDATQWAAVQDGDEITFTVYARDSWGYESAQSVSIGKDLTNPELTVVAPANNSEIFNTTLPAFIVNVNDDHLNTMWYRVFDVSTQTWSTDYVFTENGTMDETLWNGLTNSTLYWEFTAVDAAGNLNTSTITITKIANVSADPADDDTTDDDTTDDDTTDDDTTDDDSTDDDGGDGIGVGGFIGIGVGGAALIGGGTFLILKLKKKKK